MTAGVGNGSRHVPEMTEEEHRAADAMFQAMKRRIAEKLRS